MGIGKGKIVSEGGKGMRGREWEGYGVWLTEEHYSLGLGTDAAGSRISTLPVSRPAFAIPS